VDFLPGLVAPIVGDVAPNWVNKLYAFYFPVCFCLFICIRYLNVLIILFNICLCVSSVGTSRRIS